MPTWTIRKTVEIEAAHHLPDHPGPCRHPHGHRWRITVEVQGSQLVKDMLVDFTAIKGELMGLDHTDLNKILKKPTAERLAEFVAVETVGAWLEGTGNRVTMVEVEESAGSVVRWQP